MARKAHPDVKMPGRLEQKAVRFCPRCKEPFATWHEGQKYCSDRCRFHGKYVLAMLQEEALS